jgi:hypothetical protein
MRIYVITQEEPFFVPKMMRMIGAESKKNGYEVAGLTVLKPYRKNKSFKGWVAERARIYTLYELFLVGLAFVIVKVNSKFKGTNSPYSVTAVSKANGIPVFDYSDINGPDFISHITEFKIDLVISISCPQLFKDVLLKTPTFACINAHGTLLPKHRGVFGSWWMLYQNDRIGGSTIHTMVAEVDKGEIIWQKEFNITRQHSQYRIAYQTKKDMSAGIIEVVGKYAKGTILPIVPQYESSYHYAPDKKMGREFHKKGKKILVMSDLKLMLAKTFE